MHFPDQTKEPPITDRRTITVVVTSLALLCLGGLVSVVYLTAVNQDIPDLVSNVVTTSLGALAALLASTRVDPGQLPAERPSVADTPPGQLLANDGWRPGPTPKPARRVRKAAAGG